MAEVVAEMQERLLPEYEQLKKFDVCTEQQIRECIRKREKFHINITKSKKTVRDYAEFILFEKKVHKWIEQKDQIHGTRLSGLKASIAGRIIRLYREALRQFPQEERFWETYIKFSKKSVPHEVAGIYEKLLTFHGEKPTYWCQAALWSYQYGLNLPKVKEMFIRGLQRHPESEIINRTFFDVYLMEAYKMETERNFENGTLSEQEIGIESVILIYRSSKQKISNISYFLSLLNRCEEKLYVCMTAMIQKLIIDDMMVLFPLNELFWNALAQRELHGLNMDDLTKHLANTEKKDSSIWQKRPFEQRLELCCNVYQKAVKSLETTQMWTLYINAMLELNQDMSTHQVIKRKYLAAAFKEGHKSRAMSVDHYCTFVRMLLEMPNGEERASTVLAEAIKTHRKSPKLYEIWLSIYINSNDASQVMKIFRKADTELGIQSLPIWRLTLQFYKSNYGEFPGILQNLYKEACNNPSAAFGIFRSEYLEFCVICGSIKKAREVYDQLCKLPPPCLQLHQQMAQLECDILEKTKLDFARWRLCHENAVLYFGHNNPHVWIKFIQFELNHGNPKRMSVLNKQAIETLQPQLVDLFISEFTLLTAVI